MRRQNMKKFLTTFLAMLMVLSCFTMYACEDKGGTSTTEANAQESTEITTVATTEETTEEITTEETTVEETTEEVTTTEAVCAHDWIEATCLDPATCSLCGVTDGEALGHTGGLAACFKKAVCERCGKEYGKAGGHVYDAMVPAGEYMYSPATLDKCAVYYFSCSLCGRKGSKTFEYGLNVIDGALNDYLEVYRDGNDSESFLFFTDPHYISASSTAIWESPYTDDIDIMGKFYDASPATFTLCGGDWLRDSNTKESALDMMARIKGEMAENFDKYYLMVGNHDYNYQLKNDYGTIVASPHRFTPEEMADVWFEEYGKTYYTFKGENTKFYVFDSGTDWEHNQTTLNDCCHEQINWFLSELEANDDAHIALAPHIYIVTKTTVHPATREYTAISKAYNERGTYTFDGKTYDFSEKTGKVEFLIAGHGHYDFIDELNTIPVILTTTAMTSTFPTFDMIYVDYEERKLHAIRIGNGESRTMDLLPLGDE